MSHDLRHGLATIAKLAEVIAAEPGLGREAGDRVHSLEVEIRRLSVLLEEEIEGGGEIRLPETLVRVDRAAHEVVETLEPTTTAQLRCLTEPVQSAVSLTGLWRAMRNLVDNAVCAASPSGKVEVRVFSENGFAVIEVDDDGPGFGHSRGGLASLGLGIVQDFVGRYDGSLAISQGTLGGCCVRICLPAVPVLDLIESASIEASIQSSVGASIQSSAEAESG